MATFQYDRQLLFNCVYLSNEFGDPQFCFHQMFFHEVSKMQDNFLIAEKRVFAYGKNWALQNFFKIFLYLTNFLKKHLMKKKLGVTQLIREINAIKQ